MRLALLAISVAAFSGEAPLRILFLGNSYTYYNHLAGLVEGMARAATGRPVETGFVTQGGATLERVYASTDALEVLRSSRWDMVVLQEHGGLGLNQHNGDLVVNDPAGFFTWARVWDAEIRAQGARTVFLNTWARRGRGEHQPHLDWAYATIARELGAGLIPVGTAFQRVSGIELFQPDGTHPSEAGSYLAACAAVEILTARGCAGAPVEIFGVPMDNRLGRLREERGTIVRLPTETAAALQTAALAAVEELRGQGGYWRLARPFFAGEERPAPGHSTARWEGRWTGSTWAYGRKANVTLQLATQGGVCSGTWTIAALEPLTQTMLPVENCTLSQDQLRFVVEPLFLKQEAHEARVDGDRMQGFVRMQSFTPYHRQSGTWMLQRVAQ